MIQQYPQMHRGQQFLCANLTIERKLSTREWTSEIITAVWSIRTCRCNRLKWTRIPYFSAIAIVEEMTVENSPA